MPLLALSPLEDLVFPPFLGVISAAALKTMILALQSPVSAAWLKLTVLVNREAAKFDHVILTEIAVTPDVGKKLVIEELPPTRWATRSESKDKEIMLRSICAFDSTDETSLAPGGSEGSVESVES